MKIEEKLVPSGPGVTRYRELPATGWTSDKVLAELDSLANMDHSRWEDGKVSGTVYHASQELVQLQTEAYKRFAVSNPIHPDVFPGVRKMEAEIVAMVCLPSYRPFLGLSLVSLTVRHSRSLAFPVLESVDTFRIPSSRLENSQKSE